MWNLPNLLTLARIVAIVPLVAFIDAGWWVAAFALFVAAAATDWLDGWLARRRDQQSDLGRMLDPIADKLIVAAVLVAMIAAKLNEWQGFGHKGVRPFDDPVEAPSIWLVVAILSREVLVSGLREYLGPKGAKLPVSRLAKWKTAIQLAGLGFLLLSNAIWPYTEIFSWIALTIALTGETLLVISALLAWITAFAYMRSGLRHLQPAR